MLEILILVRYTKYLARLAADKGRSKSWGAFGILFWFVGEVLGFVFAPALGLDGFGAYGVAIVFAGLGAAAAYGIVASLGDESGRERERPVDAMISNASYDPANPYSPPRLE